MLWGQGIEHSDFPVIEAYADGEMPGSIRVAVAANRGENLDGHFGSCDRFLVYQVGQQAIKLIDVRSTAEADGAEDKNAARSELINDCQIVYIQSIGGPAAAKLVARRIHPMKTGTEVPIAEVVSKLQEVMRGSPPPWLRKAMGAPATEGA